MRYPLQGHYLPQGQYLLQGNASPQYPPKHHLDKGTGNSSGLGGPYPQPGYA